jgi:predicted GIY-YIG superfamily endonuclease
MIGIYKITNPEKEVYIGQSTDIEKRFKTYKKQFSNFK